MFLVTGGAGFIGSHLVERLVRDGQKVRLLDMRSPAGSWFDDMPAGQVEVVVGDIRDAETVRRAVEGVEVVFHEAAISSVPRSIEEPQETIEVNIGGTLNVLEAARQAGCRRVVFASSAAVYGDGPENPKHEGLTPNPQSPYAISKLAGEQLCRVYSQIHGLETVSLRYFNVYGPRQDPSSLYSGVISKFIDAIQKGEPVTIYGDGEQTRDFVYVSDVVEANVLAATVEEATGMVINIGSGRASSLMTLIQEVQQLSDRPVVIGTQDPRPGDIRDSVSSVQAAGRFLGFEPSVGLAAGLNYVIQSLCNSVITDAQLKV